MAQRAYPASMLDCVGEPLELLLSMGYSKQAIKPVGGLSEKRMHFVRNTDEDKVERRTNDSLGRQQNMKFITEKRHCKGITKRYTLTAGGTQQ